MLIRANHDDLTARLWLRFAIAAIAFALGLGIALLPQSQLVTLIAVVSAFIAVVAVFHEPVLGIALVMLAGPFQPLERVALQLPIDSGQILLGVALLSYLARTLVTRRAPLVACQLPITVALVAFIVVCLASFFPARDLADWVNECVKWLQLLIIALLVMNERDGRKRGIVIGAILLSAAGQAIYGIIQADVRGFGPREFQVLGNSTSFRAYGTFEQPNPFGGYMGLAWPLAAGVFLSSFRALRTRWQGARVIRSYHRYRLVTVSPQHLILFASASLGVAILCLLALQASGSRGALIGAAAAATMMVLALLKQPRRWVGALLLVSLLLVGLDVINVPPSFDGQLRQILDLDVRNAHILPTTFSTVERLAHWQAAVRMVEANPWLGVGFGNYAAAYPEFKLFIWDNALGHAHNYYLNIFAETGVIGLLAYLALWLTVFIVTWKLARRSSFSIFNSSRDPGSSLDSDPEARIGPRDHGLKAAPAERPLAERPQEVPHQREAGSGQFAVGLLGAFAALTAHHLFDNLYVANMHLLVGVYIGLVGALWLDAERHATSAPLYRPGMRPPL